MEKLKVVRYFDLENMKEFKGHEVVFKFDKEKHVYLNCVRVKADKVKINLVETERSEFLYVELYQNDLEIASAPIHHQLTYKDLVFTVFID